MNWEPAIQKVTPHVVKIATPNLNGTGFLCGYNASGSLCYVATANHVVADADEWQQPLRIYNHCLEKQIFLKESERVIFTNSDDDSAVILFNPAELGFPRKPVPLRRMEDIIGIGVEVGWLGYPGIEDRTLCFFSGSLSARRMDRSAYLIDGVAINGVSGGPVIFSDDADGVQIVGVVSAYRANRQRGDTLPGLLVAQDVSHFHNIMQRIASLDEAKSKKTEIESSNPQNPPTDSSKKP